MTALHRAAVPVVWFAALVGVAALSSVQYAAEAPDRALLRLSWRAIGERIESCRPATAAELAAAPAHMRQEVICEGARVAPYDLHVAVDGRVLSDAQAPGSGVAGDRPIYVLREFELAPGSHRVEVVFRRRADAGTTTPAPGRQSGGDREREARRRAVPSSLVLDTTVTVPPSGVLLVTYSAEARALHLAGGEPR